MIPQSAYDGHDQEMRTVNHGYAMRLSDVEIRRIIQEFRTDAAIHGQPMHWADVREEMTLIAMQPCQPIGCDAGFHLPGCRWAE